MKAHFLFLANSISCPDPLKSKFLLNRVTKETTLSGHLCNFITRVLHANLPTTKKLEAKTNPKTWYECTPSPWAAVMEMVALESGFNLSKMAEAKKFMWRQVK